MTLLNFKDAILISAAVKDELKLLIDKTSNIKSFYINNIEIYAGLLNKENILFMISGPGIVNTAYALTLLLEKITPKLIIQTGCAGAFEDSGISTGDIGVATCEIDCHTGLEPSEDITGIPLALPFPLISKNNTDYTNIFPTDKTFSDGAFQIISMNCKKQYKTVKSPFITVSTITATDCRRDSLYQAYQPCMESMEGSAAAHIALLYDIPFIEIRSASNPVGKRDTSRWDLPLAFKNANNAILEFIYNITEMKTAGSKNEE